MYRQTERLTSHGSVPEHLAWRAEQRGHGIRWGKEERSGQLQKPRATTTNSNGTAGNRGDRRKYVPVPPHTSRRWRCGSSGGAAVPVAHSRAAGWGPAVLACAPASAWLGRGAAGALASATATTDRHGRSSDHHRGGSVAAAAASRTCPKATCTKVMCKWWSNQASQEIWRNEARAGWTPQGRHAAGPWARARDPSRQGAERLALLKNKKRRTTSASKRPSALERSPHNQQITPGSIPATSD